MVDTQGAAVEHRIHQLPENVVNQIAAGEVIQRPSSALKELLENAIDAGSQNIVITVKDGGLSLLQISDDGCGIHAADLPILCRRHTTSKLAKYEDLASIGTLGFRGEALCSVSFVSRLSVTTMRRGDPHAWKASFRDSEIVPPGAQPTAGVPGTAIVVEDLFYNIPNRRNALGSAHEEYNRIFDAVAKYAIFCDGVGMSLRRHKEVRADIHTAPAFSRLDRIRAIHGAALAAALLPLSLRACWPDSHAAAPSSLPDEPSFSVEGFVVNGDHAVKKSALVLFINGRAVDCPALKRNMESVYTSLIAKGVKMWAFLDVRLPASHVDVNVHPTKSEVAFLYQTEVVEAVRAALEELLVSRNNMRTFSKAAPSAARQLASEVAAGAAEAERPAGSTQRAKSGGDHKLVRTDHRSTSLQPFLDSNPTKAAPTQAALLGGVKRKGASGRRVDALALADDVAPQAASLVVQQPNPPLVEVESVESLVADVNKAGHTGLTIIVREHTFVGHLEAGLVLLQHSTKLYLVDATRLSRDLMYQQALRRFGQFKSIRIQQPASVRDLVMIGLDAKEAAGAWTPEDGPKDTVADMVNELFLMKAELLRECFAIAVDPGGRLEGLPVLVEHYCPDLARLPRFLLALAGDVDWTDERECFRTVAEALADFYSVDGGGESRGGTAEAAGRRPLKDQNAAAPVATATADDGAPSHHEWILQHVVLPALKQHLLVPQQRARDGTVVQIAALEQLYRVFERC